MDSTFGTPECTLTAPHYRVGKFKFGTFFLNKLLEKKFKK